MATDNQNVRRKPVPARIRKVFLMPVGQSNQKKTIMVRSNEEGEETFTRVNVEKLRLSGNSKKSNSNRSTSEDDAIYSAACHA